MSANVQSLLVEPMPRERPPDFLDRLVAAGLEVFGRKGLHRSRMSDIAEVMGVSQGTLYNYVESKEALFGLLVERGADTEPLELPDTLPVRTPSKERLLRALERQIQRSFDLPRLDAALEIVEVADARAELEGIVRELYSRTEATRGPAAALERSAVDLPEMFQLFFLQFRREFFARMTRYVTLRMASGAFREFPDARVPARYIVETVTFFGRHRHGDPDGSLLPDDDTVREGVVALVVSSLIPSR